MKMTARIRRLEKKMTDRGQHFAFFNVTDCDPSTIEHEQQQLLKEYLAAGNPQPTHCVFINEIP